MEEDINLRDYINVVLKRKYWIIAMLILAFSYAGWVSINKKDVYEAKTTVLLKDTSSSQQGGAGLAAQLLGIKSSSVSDFPVVINSKSVAGIVLNDLDLRKRIAGWDDPRTSDQDLIKSLQSMAKIDQNANIIDIKVVTRDPQLSADIANGFLAAGEKCWKNMNYTEARKKREYIEGQLPRLGSDLKRAEENMKRFTLIVPEDSTLQGIELKRLEREIEIQNTSYVMLRKEYESVKLEESKEMPPFSVIDRAQKPNKPVKSKPILNFAIAFVFGGGAGTFLAFFLEYWEKTA